MFGSGAFLDIPYSFDVITPPPLPLLLHSLPLLAHPLLNPLNLPHPSLVIFFLPPPSFIFPFLSLLLVSSFSPFPIRFYSPPITSHFPLPPFVLSLTLVSFPPASYQFFLPSIPYLPPPLIRHVLP
jgi:hypothetical protein